jgi:hypothetical protein
MSWVTIYLVEFFVRAMGLSYTDAMLASALP